MSDMIKIYPPEDGGTPKKQSSIVRIHSNEFLIKAECSDGIERLTHARSRIDLWLENTGDRPADVILHLDLNPDGTRTNYNDSHFGQMNLRDFVYLKKPGGFWERVHGNAEGWICTIKVSVTPGCTALGLSPWYNYSDYLRFVGELNDSSRVRKQLCGKSDLGREIWQLEISDFSIPDENKLKILVLCRQHAYETFSSFAVEGMVHYLLSGLPEVNLEHFVFYFLPMLNVDSVADGQEYQGSYTQERTTNATSQCEWGTLDKIKPNVFILLHNWISPRQIDTVVYTYEEASKPHNKAWDIFTYFFPKQTEYGRKWEHEDNLFREKNWAFRLGEKSNLCTQYAFEKHHSDIWIWEMPWFGRDNGDPGEIARSIGKKFIKAIIQTLIRTKKIMNSVKLRGLEIHLIQSKEMIIEKGGLPVDITEENKVSLEQLEYYTGILLKNTDSHIKYKLNGHWNTFRAFAGRNAPQSTESIRIRILIDGIQAWSCTLAADSNERVPINIDISNIDEMLFIVEGCDGSTSENEYVILADARIEGDKEI